MNFKILFSQTNAMEKQLTRKGIYMSVNKDSKTSKSRQEPSGSADQYERIQNIGAVIAGSGRKKIYCLTIIGQIEGHVYLPEENKTTKYENIIPELVAIEQDKSVEGLLLILNTVGGDIEAGLAIAELIAGMSKPSVSLVIGGGHSIGVPLAVCTDYSFIAPSATMTVHPVRTEGTIIGVSQSFEYFRKMQKRISDFVVKHSLITEEKFYKLCMDTQEMAMDIGSVLEGKDAVKEGLINEIGGIRMAIDKLYAMSNDFKSHLKKL